MSRDQVPAPRIPLKLNVEFRKSYSRSGALGSLRNISMTGAFLEHTELDVVNGDKVALTFKVGGRVRKIAAEVVWRNGRGCGVQFRPQNNRDVQIVDDLMYFVETKRQSRRDILDSIFKIAA